MSLVSVCVVLVRNCYTGIIYISLFYDFTVYSFQQPKVDQYFPFSAACVGVVLQL